MNDNEQYDLDSILEEIRRKNEENLREEEAAAPQEPPKEEAPAPAEAPAEAPQTPAAPDAAMEKTQGFHLSFDVDEAIRTSCEPEKAPEAPAEAPAKPDAQPDTDMEKTMEVVLPHTPAPEAPARPAEPAPAAPAEPEAPESAQPAAPAEPEKPRNPKKEKEEEIEEYNTPEDAPGILEDLHILKSSLTLRMVLTIIIFALLSYLAASTVMPLPMPAAISYTASPMMFIGANLVLTAAAILINSAAIGGGVVAMCKLKANNDSLVAFASLAAIAHGAALLAAPQALNTRAVNLYFPLVALGMLFNTIGKILFTDRMIANFKVVSANFQKYAAVKIPREELGRFADSLTPDEQDVAYFAKAEFLTDYLKIAYNEEAVEKPSRLLAPIVMAVSLAMGILTGFVTGSVFDGLSAFAAVACICAPFTSAMVGNLPMARAAKMLYRSDTCIAGYDAIEEFHEVDTVIFDSQDLFPQGTVQMHGMKAFNREKIEDAIVDAASITSAINSPLKNIFLPVLRKQENSQLKKVSAISGEDGLGVSALVGNQRILVGNRELMDRYGIILPSPEQEAKLRRGNFEILYVARAGRLSAVFIISYNADDDIADTLYDLQEQGVQILVHSQDPFITVKRMAEIFDLDESGIAILAPNAARAYRECAKEKAKTPAYLCSTGSSMALANAILCTERVRGAISTGNILQIISMGLGFVLVAFFALSGSIVRLGCIPVMAYQLIWTLIIAMSNAMRRY